ncbi:MAG: hypothetical protein AVDCRST_MAG70-1435 [uncultured Thermomicrobiales bacterium]|uniref:Uncharacterized protein n=1 Tax=uncultured Thermomicrobiales bacterium TaxID=1645740 RepID=A0A6J4URM5_9BACT|nr:MAG: hypothetical protein AVDCRST_MAG70-1435 [uncultured Thermomicrobiales bacterium]
MLVAAGLSQKRELVTVDRRVIGEWDRDATPVAAIGGLPDSDVEVGPASVRALPGRRHDAEPLATLDALAGGEPGREIRVEVGEGVAIAEVDRHAAGREVDPADRAVGRGEDDLVGSVSVGADEIEGELVLVVRAAFLGLGGLVTKGRRIAIPVRLPVGRGGVVALADDPGGTAGHRELEAEGSGRCRPGPCGGDEARHRGQDQEQRADDRDQRRGCRTATRERVRAWSAVRRRQRRLEPGHDDLSPGASIRSGRASASRETSPVPPSDRVAEVVLGCDPDQPAGHPRKPLQLASRWDGHPRSSMLLLLR